MVRPWLRRRFVVVAAGVVLSLVAGTVAYAENQRPRLGPGETELPFTFSLHGSSGVALDTARGVYVTDYHRVVTLAAGRPPRPCCPSPDSAVGGVWRWTPRAASTSPTNTTGW
jgi:hypothetical protein